MELNFANYKYKNDKRNNKRSHRERDMDILKEHKIVLSLPRICGYFSLIGQERNFSISCKQLGYYNNNCPQVNQKHLKLDLNDQIEKTIKRNGAQIISENLDHLLRYISQNKNDFLDVFNTTAIHLKDVKIVCYRGFLRMISELPYSSNDPFKIFCCLYRGVIFLYAIKEEQGTNNAASAWGYKFEDYMLADSPNSSPNTSNPCNQGEEFNCIFRASVGNHNLIYGAEMDGIVVEDENHLIDLSDDKTTTARVIDILNDSKFVELKTRYKDASAIGFQRFNSLKWWLQSTYGRNDFIICGYRDNEGFIKSLARFDTISLPNFSKGSWDPDVCLSFCDTFFSYIKDCLKAELKKTSPEDVDLRYIPKIELMFEKTPQCIQLCKEYDHSVNLIPEWFTNSFDGIIDYSNVY